MGKNKVIAVIGNGLCGSAAAKYLSFDNTNKKKNNKIILIGPKEPTEEEFPTASCYGSHYDEGRITRQTDPSKIWGKLAQQSIQRYRSIENQSGIQFYKEVGHIVIAPIQSDYLLDAKENAKIDNSENWGGIYESSTAGWISPRNLVKAQNIIAEKNGCEIINREVIKIELLDGDEDDEEEEKFCIHMVGGESIIVDQVLVSIGGFLTAKPILIDENGIQQSININVHTAQVVRVEVSEEIFLQHSVTMPTIIFRSPGHFRCYILPPIKYPDGKFYMKLGGVLFPESKESKDYDISNWNKILNTKEELLDWYRSKGNPIHNKFLLKVFKDFFPSIEILSSHSDGCTTVHTPTGNLYIGNTRKNMSIISGGSGAAAKSSDEIGKLGAASLMDNDTLFDVPYQKLFRPQFIAKL